MVQGPNLSSETFIQGPLHGLVCQRLLPRLCRVGGVTLTARVTLPLVSRESAAFESYDQLSKSIGFSVAAAPQVAYYGNHLVLGIIRGHFIAS